MQSTILAAVLCTLLVAGCATAPSPLATQSGDPEVTVAADRGQIRSAALAELVARGVKNIQVVQDAEHSFVVQWPNTDFWSNVVHGSRYDTTSHIRLTFLFLDEGDQTRILGTVSMVTNPNSGLEYVAPLAGQQARTDMQEILESVAARLATAKAQANARQ